MWNADEERECLSNPAGRGYMGSVNVTASGKPCVPWIQVPTELCHNFPDESTIDALNYCRYIPDQQWIGTSCAVRTKTGVRLERCDVPYCGGKRLKVDYSIDRDAVFLRVYVLLFLVHALSLFLSTS